MLIPKQDRAPSSSYAEKFRSGAPVDVARVKVALIEIVPPVWRRLSIPVNLTLRRLHSVLQQAMGWKDSHPHHFRVGETLIGMPESVTDRMKDSRWVTVQDLISARIGTLYYDYGPDARWVHEVWIESVDGGTHANQRPTCLAGERACPPEETSGPDEYVEWILAARDPYGQPVVRSKTWQRTFDPERFDLEKVNAALAILQI
ncbi:MAG TPA: plasmid pRiA4b ORF-3 family protein [Thermoanaerobaculia bacterium]|jgi:hypothetical protein